MDIAQTLVRSVVRAFYRGLDTRHILIVDALVIHSALRDDDMGVLMSMNLKDLHKICGRLREDRLLHVFVRPERIEGHQHPRNRTWYYIDYRQAIDAIKWRVYTLDKKVQGDAVPEREKKEYFCGYCGAEWTTEDILNFPFTSDGIKCGRCQVATLTHDPERQAGGHEQSTRLNNQLRFITSVLPQLDAVQIPECTFEKAFDARREIKRDATNPVAPAVGVETDAAPTAVRGLADSGPKSIDVSISASDGPSAAEKEAERTRKEKVAAQNALPEWHTTSTVTGASFAGAAGNGGPSAALKAEQDDDAKPEANSLSAQDSAQLDEIFKRLQEQQARQEKEEQEDDDDEDEEDEDEEMFEDVGTGIASSVGSKRPAASGETSAADTPASSGSKRVKVAEPVDEDSDDEEIAFEDV